GGIEQNIMVSIDNDVKQAQTSFDRVEATKQARLYAEAALDAEEKKLQQGKSTSFVVLTMQSNLTTARSTEIGALTDYNKSLVQLSLDEGSTLDRHSLNFKVQ
ncbi:MAG: TolC family protein, partial [Candidatus Omnitrophica bacterium]|nr:TolC family protein [Candidatus Omnitrophota bacterium]